MIRAIFRDGTLKPLDPVELPENTCLTVALLDGDDLPADAVAQLAGQDESFDFLKDPREDVYSEVPNSNCCDPTRNFEPPN